MQRIIILSVFVVMTFGCTSTNTTQCSDSYDTLSDGERSKLEEITLTNEYLSGCVTEKILDFCEGICQYPDRECEQGESLQIDYYQWVKIYKACIAH